MVRLNVLSALAGVVGYATAVDVFAHFMVTNSYAYDIDQWKKDMADARQMGIDGFSLNWQPPLCKFDPNDPNTNLTWFAERAKDAFTAAEQMIDEKKPFKLYHSFDFDQNDCENPFTKEYIKEIVDATSGSGAYRWNTNVLVTTFGGDIENYGDSFFNGLKEDMRTGGNPISLAPALTSYTYPAQNDASSAASDMISEWKSNDGFKNWQSWPLGRKENMTTEVDQVFSAALQDAGRTGPYIMTISPAQFKYWPGEGGEWVQYSDTLWVDRWSSLVGPNAFKPDIIEIVTWNDWPESHYIRDLFDMEDNSVKDYSDLEGADGAGIFKSYVEGQNHSPWRIIAKHYIAKLKGWKCKPIMDQVIFWHRITPAGVGCNQGVKNYDLPEDAVFAWALVQAQSTITVTVGDNTETFEADQSGPVMFKVPFPSNLGSGVTPEVSITQNGKVVQSGKSTKPITNSCGVDNNGNQVPNMNFLVNLVGPGKNHGRDNL